MWAQGLHTLQENALTYIYMHSEADWGLRIEHKDTLPFLSHKSAVMSALVGGAADITETAFFIQSLSASAVTHTHLSLARTHLHFFILDKQSHMSRFSFTHLHFTDI